MSVGVGTQEGELAACSARNEKSKPGTAGGQQDSQTATGSVPNSLRLCWIYNIYFVVQHDWRTTRTLTVPTQYSPSSRNPVDCDEIYDMIRHDMR